MKAHTQRFKNSIKELGRELDSKITFSLNGEEIELGSEKLNSITPHYEASILKSVMKQLDIDSNVDIPLNTVLNYKFGVRPYGQGEFEYVNFGNYIVYSSEKQEDTRSYKITCYDKMLYTMKDYEKFTDEYPMSINDYIDKLCAHLGLVFKNKENSYANKDKIIENELYLSNDGGDLGYTYRDVFDELAQVTASTIVINEDTDELEIRYINDTSDTIDEEYFKDVNVNFGEKYGPINSIVLSRAGESDNIYLQNEESVEENGLCEIKIVENQIMNFNNRDEFLPDILEKLDGLEYYINDYESYGIMYYNVCDRYNVSIDDKIYSCVMFNDDIKVSQGLGETVYCDEPDSSVTNYKKADKTDRRINQAYIIVDKQNLTIESLVSKTIPELQEDYTELREDLNNYAPNTALEELTNQVAQITTDTYTKTEVNQIASGVGVDGVKVTYVVTESGLFDFNGLTIDRTGSPTKGRFSHEGLQVIEKLGDTGEEVVILNASYNSKTKQTEVNASNLRAKNYLMLDDVSRFQNYVSNGQIKTGCFWIKNKEKVLNFSVENSSPYYFAYNIDKLTFTSNNSYIDMGLDDFTIAKATLTFNEKVEYLDIDVDISCGDGNYCSLIHKISPNSSTYYIAGESTGKYSVHIPLINAGEQLEFSYEAYGNVPQVGRDNMIITLYR